MSPFGATGVWGHIAECKEVAPRRIKAGKNPRLFLCFVGQADDTWDH